MAQFHWDPASYLDLMSLEVPDYERLQDKTVGATGMGATRILELGTGTGETARRMLARHPTANLIGLDASTQMLEHARAGLPGSRVELRVARLEDPLPPGLLRRLGASRPRGRRGRCVPASLICGCVHWSHAEASEYRNIR